MRTPSGVIPGVVLLLRDITRLRELDRLKSEFVMTASHELRTPLTSINMAVNLLRESAGTKLTDQERALLEACHEDVQRLRALVNDLLDLSKIEAGKLELAFEPVQPRLLGDQALSVIKAQAESKGIELTLGVPEDLPEVTADPHKIVWVLVNLLANAVRYTKAGGHISLTGERVGNQVHLPSPMMARGFPLTCSPGSLINLCMASPVTAMAAAAWAWPSAKKLSRRIGAPSGSIRPPVKAAPLRLLCPSPPNPNKGGLHHE